MEIDILIDNFIEPEPSIVFTRYLYIKQEVKLALLASLLNKKNDALFWAYELYYSGFVYELMEFIFKIYYDFYAILNDGFENYLLKKTRDILKDFTTSPLDNDKIIGSIIKNLLVRPLNIDVFMLQNICNIFEVDCQLKDKELLHSDIEEIVRTWVREDDYLSISQFVLNECDKLHLELKYVYGIVLDAFIEIGVKINKSKQIIRFTRSKIISTHCQQVLLAKIMQLFAQKHDIVCGKNKYVSFDVCDIISYETIDNSKEGIPIYRVLRHACKLGVDDQQCLSLFDIARNKMSHEEVLDIYNASWAYYAYWCPFWMDRIIQYNGNIDSINKKILFDNDDLLEEFHNSYDYEPDEQPLSVKNKCIMPIEINTRWSDFYERHKNESLFKLDDDMIFELCQTKIKYTK